MPEFLSRYRRLPVNIASRRTARGYLSIRSHLNGSQLNTPFPAFRYVGPIARLNAVSLRQGVAHKSRGTPDFSFNVTLSFHQLSTSKGTRGQTQYDQHIARLAIKTSMVTAPFQPVIIRDLALGRAKRFNYEIRTLRALRKNASMMSPESV